LKGALLGGPNWAEQRSGATKAWIFPSIFPVDRAILFQAW